MQTNLPFLDATVADLLETGSLLSNKLLEFFSVTQPFEQRPKKSLSLAAVSSVADSPVGVDITTEFLELYYLEGSLNVSPDNYRAVHEVADVCKLSFATVPTDDFQFSSALLQAIQNANCSVVACPASSCRQDNITKDFFLVLVMLLLEMMLRRRHLYHLLHTKMHYNWFQKMFNYLDYTKRLIILVMVGGPLGLH